MQSVDCQRMSINLIIFGALAESVSHRVNPGVCLCNNLASCHPGLLKQGTVTLSSLISTGPVQSVSQGLENWILKAVLKDMLNQKELHFMF